MRGHGRELAELGAARLERPCTLHHIWGGARETRLGWLTRDDDRIWVAWGVAGAYQVSVWTGKVRGTKWRLSRGDLAWFRARSRRWAERRRRFADFLNAHERD